LLCPPLVRQIAACICVDFKTWRKRLERWQHPTPALQVNAPEAEQAPFQMLRQARGPLPLTAFVNWPKQYAGAAFPNVRLRVVGLPAQLRCLAWVKASITECSFNLSHTSNGVANLA
jgi:hypothetical protein